MTDPRPLVLYHADCTDGFGAAFAAWCRYGDDAEYRAVSYGEALPASAYAGRVVEIFDFSFGPKFVESISTHAESVTLLDHHKSAADAFAGWRPPANVRVAFDMERSGAVLAWKHYFPDREPPLLLQYVEDRDLWRWAIADSRAYNAALRLYVHDFDVWNGLAARPVYEMVAEGEIVLRYQELVVAEIARRQVPIRVGPYQVPAVCAPILQSEIGHRLADREPFAVVWYPRRLGGLQLSLRSRIGEEQTLAVDVSKVAEFFGGGGHPGAAGCSVETLETLHRYGATTRTYGHDLMPLARRDAEDA